jgi:hypothetical protein
MNNTCISDKARRFGGKHHLHFHGRKVNKATNQLLLHAGFFLGLLFDLEDEGDAVVRSVGLFRTAQRYNSGEKIYTVRLTPYSQT